MNDKHTKAKEAPTEEEASWKREIPMPASPSENSVITEPICPGCRSTTNVRVLQTGWLFRCDKCNWEYGHSQLLDRSIAYEALTEARKAGL